MKSTPGPLLGPRKRHVISMRIKAVLNSNPNAELTDIVRLTGCGREMATLVRRKWRAQRGIPEPAPRITDDQSERICQLVRAGVPRSAVASEFRISRTSVDNVWFRRTGE